MKKINILRLDDELRKAAEEATTQEFIKRIEAHERKAEECRNILKRSTRDAANSGTLVFPLYDVSGAQAENLALLIKHKQIAKELRKILEELTVGGEE